MNKLYTFLYGLLLPLLYIALNVMIIEVGSPSKESIPCLIGLDVFFGIVVVFLVTLAWKKH